MEGRGSQWPRSQDEEGAVVMIHKTEDTSHWLFIPVCIIVLVVVLLAMLYMGRESKHFVGIYYVALLTVTFLVATIFGAVFKEGKDE